MVSTARRSLVCNWPFLDTPPPTPPPPATSHQRWSKRRSPGCLLLSGGTKRKTVTHLMSPTTPVSKPSGSLVLSPIRPGTHDQVIGFIEGEKKPCSEVLRWLHVVFNLKSNTFIYQISHLTLKWHTDQWKKKSLLENWQKILISELSIMNTWEQLATAANAYDSQHSLDWDRRATTNLSSV